MGREKGHPEEQLNLRCFYLRLLKKIWILPVACIIGAILGFAIYYLATVTYGPARSYSAESTLYITFAHDETGTVYDYYNAYTWNQLILTDDVMDEVMAELGRNGIPELSEQEAAENSEAGSLQGVTRSQVMESLSADLPSDIRVMILTVTNHDEALTREIQLATEEALVKYGQTQDVFTRIDVRRSAEPSVVTYTDRTTAAVITGAVLALIATVFGLFFLASLDDAIYVPEDGEKRYDLYCLGMLPAKEEAEPFYRNELIANFGYRISELSRVAVMSLGDTSGTAHADRELQHLLQTLGNDFDASSTQLETVAVPDADLESFRRIHGVDGAILLLPAGKKDGTRTERVLSQLKKHDCKVLGFVLTDTDTKFMKRYYRMTSVM